MLLLLTLACLTYTLAQQIEFELVNVDTQYHDRQNRLPDELIIDNQSTFWRFLSERKYNIVPPRFPDKIFISRSIQADCIQRITNTVVLDSVQQTVTWLSTLERSTCAEKKVRHLTISIPRPPEGYSVLFDTLWTTASQPLNTQITEIPMNNLTCKLNRVAGLPLYPLPVVINSDSLYQAYQLGDAINCTSRIDFDSELILASTYSGDCLMHLMPHSFFDPITNTLVLKVYNIYGGCRAAGRVPLAVVVPKPSQEGYKVLFQEIRVENWEEYKTHTDGHH